MLKLICIRLRYYSPLIRLLHKILVPLLVREQDRIFLAIEAQVCALHEVRARLPAHKRVFPAVTFGENVPIHTPVLVLPVTGLGGWFCGAVDTASSLD